MAEPEDLHEHLLSLEKRLAEKRAQIAKLDKTQRQGLGALLETISEKLDHHEDKHGNPS